jgi:hypothetical protein
MALARPRKRRSAGKFAISSSTGHSSQWSFSDSTSRRHVVRRGFGQPPMAVDEQPHVRPDRLAHGGNALETQRQLSGCVRFIGVFRLHVVERCDLDGIESARERIDRARGKPGRTAIVRSAVDVRIEADRGSLRIAERHRQRFAAPCAMTSQSAWSMALIAAASGTSFPHVPTTSITSVGSDQLRPIIAGASRRT